MSPARGEIIGGMATIGFIGSGMIGGTVARLSVAAGHMVVLSNSRGPDTLKDLVAELGSLARAESVDNTAEEGDLVVVPIKRTDFTAAELRAAGACADDTRVTRRALAIFEKSFWAGSSQCRDSPR